MPRRLIILSTILFFISCNDGKRPDVSSIQVKVELKRFEQDLFGLDTNRLSASLPILQEKYPHFLPDFTYNILGLRPDSLVQEGYQMQAGLSLFIHDYAPIRDSADKLFKNFNDQLQEIIYGLKHVKFYFPEYHLPPAVLTFIGPMDASFQTSFGTQGDILTEEGLGIGLQLHLGKNFSFYESEQGLALFPEYISNNFTPESIPVNCMKNICDDLYPDRSAGKSLIDQMVEKGKRLYLLQAFLPKMPEHLLIGYSEKQLKDSYTNEAVIWDFFLNNQLLNTAEQNMIKNYIGESPKTQEFGEGSPGNLGSFAGWQIVKKYMNKFPETTLKDMMAKDAHQLYTDSKYKPRN